KPAPATTRPQDPSRRRLFEGLAAIGAAIMLPAAVSESAEAAPAAHGPLDAKLRHHVKNVVVIYLENRSFNNLYGNFPGVRHPLSKAPAEACIQLDRDGSRLKNLPKIWGGLVPTGQTVAGKYYLIEEDKIQNLPNGPFPLKDADGEPLPEAVITRDLWHLFYENQMEINGGKNDQFAAWADSGALVMGY
ncbi:acid phosphatase, partial [Pseudomonas sp. MWU13-2860]